MKKARTWLLLTLFLLLTLTGAWYYSRFSTASASTPAASSIVGHSSKKLSAHGQEIKQFCKKNKYNTECAFLIDMSIESGKNRFFILDLSADSVTDAALVTHGRCNENWLKGRKYSNVVGSGCTSLGRYKIGNAYQGRFGLAYKLHGLDSSNSNAYKRFVVLHSHDCVPNQPTSPLPICQSDGCPTVSPEFLQKLKKIIDASNKPIVLWVYE